MSEAPTSTISAASVAYATDENGSDAKIGSASRFRSSVSSIASVRIGCPTSARFESLDALRRGRLEPVGCVPVLGRSGSPGRSESREDAAEPRLDAGRRPRGRRAGSPGSRAAARRAACRARRSARCRRASRRASRALAVRADGGAVQRDGARKRGCVELPRQPGRLGRDGAPMALARQLGRAPRDERRGRGRAVASVQDDPVRDRAQPADCEPFCRRRTTAAAPKRSAPATPVSQGRPGAASSVSVRTASANKAPPPRAAGARSPGAAIPEPNAWA